MTQATRSVKSTDELTSLVPSLWKTLQHKFANASSEEDQVELSCRRLQQRGKICSTMSHAQDETL